MAAETWSRYQLLEKIFAIGEDFWIENERGEQAYKVDGAAFSLRHRFVLQDPAGNDILEAESKLLSLQPTVNIEKHGQPYATVSKELFTFLHQTYDIALVDGTVYKANGDITNHEYAVTGTAGQVAQMSRAWFSIRDSYGVAVAPGVEVPLMLAAAVCIEEISERERERR